MDNIFVDLAFSTLITLLRRLQLSPKSKEAYEKVFLKIFSLIWAVWGADERFRAAVGLPAEGEQ